MFDRRLIRHTRAYSTIEYSTNNIEYLKSHRNIKNCKSTIDTTVLIIIISDGHYQTVNCNCNYNRTTRQLIVLELFDNLKIIRNVYSFDSFYSNISAT